MRTDRQHVRATDDRRGERCDVAWCITDHGATVHPDDEEHRSVGVSARVEYASSSRDAPVSADVEIGLVRAREGARTWLAIEDGRGIALRLPIDRVREIVAALREDAAVATRLDIGQ